MRLIDADALVEVLGDPHMMVMLSKTKAEETGEWGMLLRRMDVLRRVLSAPTIDAAPVVHARWVKAHGMMPPEYHHRKQCDMCGGWALQDYFGREQLSHYCPNCGAKMDGGAET